MEKTYIALAVLIAIGLIVSVWSALSIYSNPQNIRESFENGFGEWNASADVPSDPNNTGQSVEWRINRVANVSHSGKYALEFFIDGRQDDGTIWIEKKISVKKQSQIQIRVSFWFYSEQESFNTIAVVCAYVGVENPTFEDDFTVLGAANEVAGWKKYAHVVDLDAGSSGEFWVAIGTSVRWETQMTYYIDDVEIEISP